MSWLHRVLAAAPQPGSLEDPRWWDGKSGTAGGAMVAGQFVSPDTALTVGAVFRAVRLLSDDIAQLPLHTFRLLPDRVIGMGKTARTAPGGKERVRSPLAEVIGTRPNARQTSFEFRQMLSAHLLLRGNGYARIVPGPRGSVSELIPMVPQRMRVVLTDSGRKGFIYRNKQGREETYTQDEVFHLCGFQTDAETPEGIPPVTLARKSLSLSMATEDFGTRQFSQTPRPSMVLTHPGRLDKDVSDRISSTFRLSSSGPDGWGNSPVLEDGMGLVQVGMSHDDAQFLETRQFQTTDVARWFGVPPHMIGDLSRSTFSNIEQQSIDYVTHSLLPWLVLWEQSIARDLVTDDTFAEFVVDGLLRGDQASAAAAESQYVTMRAATPNEVRARRNMNPVPWGDDPVALPGAQAFGPPRTSPAPAADAPDAEEPADPEDTADA